LRPNSNRILIVDDSEAIHRDIIKILDSSKNTETHRDLDQMEMVLFDDDPMYQNFQPGKINSISYRIDSAFQGREAIEMVDRAAEETEPYALVFMDVRMPPGLNGIDTIDKIWQKHPDIEMVIVTAFSDHSWEDILLRMGPTDRLMVLRKPFDMITIKQLTLALTKKYNISVKVQNYIDYMELEFCDSDHRIGSMVQELKQLLR